jgi:uncharacterized protein (TIGR00251 family)
MRLHLKVTPNASRSEIIAEENGDLKVKVQAPPEAGKANKAAIKLIAKYFKVPQNRVKIISGKKFHQKIVEIFDSPNNNTSGR